MSVLMKLFNFNPYFYLFYSYYVNLFNLLHWACLVLVIRDNEYQFNVFCYQNKSINPTSCFSALRLFTSEKAFNPNDKLTAVFLIYQLFSHLCPDESLSLTNSL